jgi:hypothetical protein
MNTISLSRGQASLLALAIEKLPKSVTKTWEESKQQELYDLYEMLHIFANYGPIFARYFRSRLQHMGENRLFIGRFPCGLVYADRAIEEHGDYKRVGFLSYKTLVFEPGKKANPRLLSEAIRHANTIQAMRGEKFEISGCGQYVILGE